MFLPQEIIRKKRDKKSLSKEEINFFIKGVANGKIADSQIGSLTMAIFLNGLNKKETADLTLSMRNSGNTLKWGMHPVIDKHSSGGVGDKVSLMLAPMLAACGGFVPMISGRGLGHTGGTLDKFDSIPGYQTMPDNKLFVDTVKKVGCAIIGQTGKLAPADKKIYAIRDVSATVESIPLITASILSKKLAAGLDCLVMDLKCGNGAFMSSFKDARTLAKSIVEVASLAGTKCTALLTDMNQVLGHTAGNALEVIEAVEYLNGTYRDPRLHETTLALCAELLVSSKLQKDLKSARQILQKNLDNGKALEKFSQMVAALKGPKDFVEKYQKHLPKTKISRPIFAEKAGFVESMNTRNIGLSIINLKGGRTHPEQKLDYATGFTRFCQIGDNVNSKTPLCIIHAQDEKSFAQAETEIKNNIKISSKKPKLSATIIEEIK